VLSGFSDGGFVVNGNQLDNSIVLRKIEGGLEMLAGEKVFAELFEAR